MCKYGHRYMHALMYVCIYIHVWLKYVCTRFTRTGHLTPTCSMSGYTCLIGCVGSSYVVSNSPQCEVKNVCMQCTFLVHCGDRARHPYPRACL